MAAVWALALERNRILRALLRHRWVVLAVAAVGAALLEVHTTGPSSDGPYFAAAGTRLLSSDGLHVYAARGLQAGPLQVAAFGVLSRACSVLHLPEDPAFAVLSAMASTALVLAGVRALRARVGLAASPTAELLTGVLAVGWLLATEVYTSGHPAELVIPVLWIWAGLLASEDRAAWAGVLIGLGAGFETWAVLGLPVLLLSGRVPAAARGLAAMSGVVAAVYLPFVLAGPFRMGQAVWGVAPGSLVHALDPGLDTFPWSARLLQSLGVVAIGFLAWGASRRSPSTVVLTVWLVPAAIAMAKAISEPGGYDWYWLPAEVALLAGCACADGLPRRVVVATAVAEAVVVSAPLRAWPVALAALAGLLITGRHPGTGGRVRAFGRVQRVGGAA
jgi:hypothetical protein